MKKQGLKTEGFQDQFSSFLDSFWVDFRVKLSPEPLPERGRFFQKKMGAKKSIKNRKKNGPRGYAHH